MKISREVKTGALVVAALALFIYGFNFLKGKDIFSTRDVYYAVYPEVVGLVEANPVQYNGLKVGRVKSIQILDTSGRIIVSFAIADNRMKIPKNSVAKIISPEFLGGKAIQIIPSSEKDMAKDGDTLVGIVEASLQESVNATIKPLKDKAENLIASIDSIMEVVSAILDKNTRENLTKSFDNIKHALETFDRTAMRFDTMIASEKNKLSVIFSRVESISTNLANNNNEIAGAIKNFSSISDTLAKANLSRTIENANKALSDMVGVIEKINKGEGTAGLLVKDEKLYHNLNSASASLDSLLKDIKDHPGKYVPFKRDKRKGKR